MRMPQPVSIRARRLFRLFLVLVSIQSFTASPWLTRVWIGGSRFTQHGLRWLMHSSACGLGSIGRYGSCVTRRAPCMLRSIRQASVQDNSATPHEEVGFFLVGDIGEGGRARERVAQAMARLQNDHPGKWSFVICTGDNFYRDAPWKTDADVEAAFDCLEREMLAKVGVPWYFTLGNHDLAAPARTLHKRMHGASGRGKEFTERNTDTSTWQWRCPGTGSYSVGEDWAANTEGGLPAIPSDLVDIFVLNTCKFQMMLDPAFNWDQQKLWLKEKLVGSDATWKIVVGHHPIEYIPYSYLEHVVPGLRWLTTTFMTGKPLVKKMYSGSLADVVILGGTDAYICGHQHLMAHLIRESLPRRLTLWTQNATADCSYLIVGSSSRLEDEGDNATAVPRGVEKKFQNQRKKMREFWWAQQVGFATVHVTDACMTYEFFSVTPDGVPESEYRYTKRK